MRITTGQGRVFFKSEHGGRFEIVFHRTLRLPEDGKTHNLPPSMGQFPVKQVDDYKSKVPASWVEHGGIFLPMYQREALWLGFMNPYGYAPNAVKVAAGQVNAVSGETWKPELAPSGGDPSNPRQDYMVAPPQPWLDGFNAGSGVIKQFVAMPLGMGYTVEGQVTGKEEFGGIQLLVVPPKEGRFKKPSSGVLRTAGAGSGLIASGMSHTYTLSSTGGQSYVTSVNSMVHDGMATMDFMEQEMSRSVGAEIGLAAGGSMEQKIYPDPHGIDTWDQGSSGRLYVHIVNSEMWRAITGEQPPATPISAQTYTQHGYPWYEVYDEGMGDVPASGALAGVKTVAGKDKEHGFKGLQDDSPIVEKATVGYPVETTTTGTVRDGKW